MRIRSIHPDACVSETLAGLSGGQERTFWRLLTYCDDAGRALANPKLIKAAIYPLVDDMTAEAVQKDLQALESAGLIQLYAHLDKTYLWVCSWEEFQHPKNPSPSKLPPPPKVSTPGLPQAFPPPTPELPQAFSNPSPGLPQALPRPNPLELGVGEGEGEGITSPLHPPPSPDGDPPEPLTADAVAEDDEGESPEKLETPSEADSQPAIQRLQTPRSNGKPSPYRAELLPPSQREIFQARIWAPWPRSGPKGGGRGNLGAAEKAVHEVLSANRGQLSIEDLALCAEAYLARSARVQDGFVQEVSTFFGPTKRTWAGVWQTLRQARASPERPSPPFPAPETALRTPA